MEVECKFASWLFLRLDRLMVFAFFVDTWLGNELPPRGCCKRWRSSMARAHYPKCRGRTPIPRTKCTQHRWRHSLQIPRANRTQHRSWKVAFQSRRRCLPRAHCTQHRSRTDTWEWSSRSSNAVPRAYGTQYRPRTTCITGRRSSVPRTEHSQYRAWADAFHWCKWYRRSALP